VSGLALLCPGQGHQHPALLELALADARGAAVVRRAGDATGLDVAALARRGGAELFVNAVAQPLVCAAELATWAALRESLAPPRVVAGYSLGELAAYGCAGALAPEEAVALASRRAALMDAAAPPGSGLLALRGLPIARVEALAVQAGAEVAIVNGPDHCVAGGELSALERLEVLASRAGASTLQRLPVSVPAHTTLLAGAVAPFAAALQSSQLADPLIPVLAGVSGGPVRSRVDAIAALSLQLARRLEWARCLATAAEMGCSVFLELGPGTALARMAAELVPGARARSAEEFRSLDGIARWAAAGLG
jgi:[acyl-carrier-protein] S-malonyltransferase